LDNYGIVVLEKTKGKPPKGENKMEGFTVMNGKREKPGKKPVPAHDYKELVKIAKECIGLEDREDLERHWSDSEDFFETAVWCLEDALIKAYKLGKGSK